MVRPVQFGFNEQTAVTNTFQKTNTSDTRAGIQAKALAEFNALVKKIQEAGIDVLVMDDTLEPATPDSIFPNNWISFHEDGTLVLYPMLAENRRLERRTGIIEKIKKEFLVKQELDYTHYETQNLFLEGTGSIVFDYENQIAYACISQRTDKQIATELFQQLNFEPIFFTAVNQAGVAVYHTNVVMCLAKKYCVVCLDSIVDINERKMVVEKLQSTKHEIINITAEQMNAFAGNMYELFNKNEASHLLMSEQAFKALTPNQINVINQRSKIIYSPIYTIEELGGGSARCMIADIRLPTPN